MRSSYLGMLTAQTEWGQSFWACCPSALKQSRHFFFLLFLTCFFPDFCCFSLCCVKVFKLYQIHWNGVLKILAIINCSSVGIVCNSGVDWQTKKHFAVNRTASCDRRTRCASSSGTDWSAGVAMATRRSNKKQLFLLNENNRSHFAHGAAASFNYTRKRKQEVGSVHFRADGGAVHCGGVLGATVAIMR